MATPADTKAPAATPTPEDEFASAFSEAVAADVAETTPDTPPDTPPEPEPEAPPLEPVPQTPVVPPKPSDTPPETPPEEPETPPEPEPEAPEARIARLEAENAALKAPKPALAPTPQPTPETPPQAPETPAAAAPEAPAAPAEPVWYVPTDDEKGVLADLEKNWPDIATAQQVAIKQAVYNAVQYTFSQIAKTYNPALQRFAELSDVISEQLALSALRGEHQDYDEVYDKVVQWVETLPVAFKTGAKQTMASGTPEEVAELITEYKKLHPAVTPAVGVAPVVPVTPQRKTELSAAAKQAASRLRVVGSKRTTPVVAADPNDFNAAWDEAITSGS